MDLILNVFTNLYFYSTEKAVPKIQELLYNSLKLFVPIARKLKIKTGILKKVRDYDAPEFIKHEGTEFYVNDALFTMSFEKQETLFLNNIISKQWTVIDIGAHIGYHTKTLSRLSRKVYSFEPDDDNIYYLRKNCSHLPNVIIQNIAVGHKSGIVNWFRNTKCNYDHSTIPNRDRIPAGIKEMKKLDDFQIPVKVDFIKIDTQGNEKEILQGAVNLLKRDKPILMVELDKGCSNIYELIKEIKKLGYTIYSLNRKGCLTHYGEKYTQNVICKIL